MDTPAFGAGKGKACHQRSHRVRGCGKGGETAGIADDTGLTPHLLTQLGRRDPFWRCRRRCREAGRQARLVKRGESRTPTEDQTLKQRVGREPVGAVDSSSGALPCRIPVSYTHLTLPTIYSV